MKGWKLITLAVALGVVLMFAAVTIARGANGGSRGGWGMMGGGWMMGDRQGQDGDNVGPCGGAGAELMSDPAFRADMQKLRDEHRKDMQTWSDKYGADTSSAAAQKALDQLRTEHWNDMRSLFDKYGVELPDTPPAGRGGFGAGCGGTGGCGGQGGATGTQGQNSGTGMMGGGMMGAGSI